MNAKRKRAASAKTAKSSESAVRSEAKGTEESVSRSELLRLACLAGGACMLVATAMLPGEAAAEWGVGNVLAVGWLVVAGGWLALFTLDRQSPLWFNGGLIAVLAFGAWRLANLGLHWGTIHMRPAVNMTLVYLGATACVFVLVQILRGRVERNGWLVLLIVMGVGLASHGLHQYFVSMPRTAQEYEDSEESEKQRILQQFNLDGKPGSADREHFENRLHSSEPFASFGLANSLAGFLAPIVVLIVAAGWSELGGARRALPLGSLALCFALCVFCLMLTKSRTGYLAAFTGLVLLCAFQGGLVRRNLLMFGAIASVAVVLVIAMGVLVGGLDSRVISESAKSFQYRLEYWQASLAMIADSPLLGCGPGQFQSMYTAFKLPYSSETVSDPHNFVIEVAATAGLPGLLILLTAIWLTLRGVGRAAALRNSADVGREESQTPQEALLAKPPSDPSAAANSVRIAINLGAALGVFAALAAGAMVNHIPDAWAMIAMLCAFALAAPLMWGGVRIPSTAVKAALSAWAINLLAAGGFGFPGVAIVGWTLFALLIVRSESQCWKPPQEVRLALLAAVAVLVLAGMQFGTRPLQARFALTSPLSNNSFNDSVRLATEASERDPLWMEPWSRLADVYQHRWLQSGEAKHRRAMENAMQKLLELDPKTWLTHRHIGKWRLSAWRARGNPDDLKLAIQAFEDMVSRFPNSIEAHAQLAWTLHLQGDARAAQEAARALELDSQNPHREHKIDRVRIYDPGASSFVTGQPAAPAQPTEPLMKLLRSKASE